MPYANAQDIINDALFRAGEIPGASEWDAKAVDYLNRTYQAICTGASEFLPEFIEDWWWLRANGVLTLDPVRTAGTVNVVKGSTDITFTDPHGDPPAGVGNRLRIAGTPDVFVLSSKEETFVLDSPYTGDTNTAATYEMFRVVYPLSNAVAAIISPIVAFRENPQIMGMSPERLDTLWPLVRLQAGVPQAFALESETSLRFSHGGLTDRSMRIEFRYRPAVDSLENLTSSIPLLPFQWRQILSDTTTTYIMLDKNDDRATSVGQAARAGLQAMVRENRRRIAKMDGRAGKILPRQTNTRASFDRVLRTEGGFIIG